MTLVLRSVPLVSPWEAYVLPLSGFPAPAEEVNLAREFLRKLLGALGGEGKLLSEVFIQFASLHLGDGPARMAKHVSEWRPEGGLGVWPDRPPPRNYNRDDFLTIGPGDPPPVLIHQLFRVTGGPRAQDACRDAMLGLGTIVQILTRRTPDHFRSEARKLLLPRIQDPMLTQFPFYAPLLQAASLQTAGRDHLEEWFCGASLYVRESQEDCGILLAGPGPLAPKLRGLGVEIQ